MPARDRAYYREIEYEEDVEPEQPVPTRYRALWIAGAVVLAVLVVLAFGTQWATLSSLNRKAESLTKSIAQVQDENAQLSALRDRVATEAGAEQDLHDLGWLKEGETALVPRPEEKSPSKREMVSFERRGTKPPNWVRWWQWFFGTAEEKQGL